MSQTTAEVTVAHLLDLLQAAALARDPDERADHYDLAMRSGLMAARAEVLVAATDPEAQAAVLMWMRLFPGAADLHFIAALQGATDPSLRAAAVSALQLVELDTARPAYQRALEDAAALVRVRAVRSLGERRDPAVRSLLGGAAADVDEGVRSWATWALEQSAGT